MSVSISRNAFLKLSGAAGVVTVAASFAANAAQDAPIWRTIPKSGEKLPVIGLGTGRGLESIRPAERVAVLKALFDGGGKVIDTAPSYGNAEISIGTALAAFDGHPRAFLATKLGTEGRENGIASMEESFQRLRTNTIDLMQVHNLRDTKTHLVAMRDWKAQGRIRYIGVTHWQMSAHNALADVLTNEPLDFVQLNYSVNEREAERRLLPLAADKGVAVVANVPFGSGRLLRTMKDKPLPGWASEVGVTTWAQLLLKFVISHPAVTVAIPATREPIHMAENTAAGRGVLLDVSQRRALIQIWDNI